jgi:hypothetical protein
MSDEYHSAEEDTSDDDGAHSHHGDDALARNFWCEMDPGSKPFRANLPIINALWAQAVENRCAATLIRAARRSEGRTLECAIGEADERDFVARLRWMTSPRAAAEDGTRFPIDYNRLLECCFVDHLGLGPGSMAAKTLVELGNAHGHAWSVAAQELRNRVLEAAPNYFDRERTRRVMAQAARWSPLRAAFVGATLSKIS